MHDHPVRSAPPFHVESILSSTEVVLSLEGELDIAGLDLLTAEVHRAATQSARRVRLDLRGLTFVDGTGVRAVVAAALVLGERLVAYPGPPWVHHVFTLTGADSVVPFVSPPAPRAVGPASRADNVEFVRRVWQAFRSGGGAAVASLVPSEVEWCPSVGGGQVLRGPEELRSFWAARRVGPAVQVTEFRAVGDDVLVRCEYPGPRATPRVVWSLYRFSETVLRRAETYDSEREALAQVA